MAIIPVPPAFSFTRVSKFGLTRRTNILASRYMASAQRVVYPYAVWEFDGTLVDYDGPEAAAIRSFFAKLEGSKHTFRLPVPGYTKSGYTGYLVASNTTARQSSLEANIGLSQSMALFKEGDYFTINDEFKIVTEAVATAANGFATINFKPALRKSIVTGTQLGILNPTVLMYATEDDVASWGLNPPFRHSLELRAIEAIEI